MWAAILTAPFFRGNCKFCLTVALFRIGSASTAIAASPLIWREKAREAFARQGNMPAAMEPHATGRRRVCGICNSQKSLKRTLLIDGEPQQNRNKLRSGGGPVNQHLVGCFKL